MSRNDGIKRCVWCGESGNREHPIVQDEDGDNYHNICLAQQAKELAQNKNKEKNDVQ